MAKRVRAIVKLQIPAGKATPAPPIGPALGQHGVAIMNFVKEYNERTAQMTGQIVPVVITVFEDRSFTFVTKTPPAADLLRRAAGIEKGSGAPNREKLGRVTRAQLREIAELKLKDLNAVDIDGAIKQMEAEAPRVKVTLAVGQAVRIIDGPFADFQGVIDEINQEKGKVKVLVSFFGRETPVELDFLQVEKLVK